MGWKKGQASLFIVLGVLVLFLAIGMVFVLRSSVVSDEEFVVEQVSAELLPVKQYVEECLYQTSLTAMHRVGSTGGYIYPSAAGLRTVPSDPTSSDAFAYTPVISTAYWYYLRSPNTCTECTFASARPSLDGPDQFSIASQIQRYIVDELDACLDGFTPLQTAGYVIEPQQPMRPQVRFTRNDVTVFLAYPLAVRVAGSDAMVSEYITSLDIPFRQMYDHASLLAGASERNAFLERHVLELIHAYAGVDRDRLPPTNTMTFDFSSSIFWTEFEVKNKITVLLASYVPALRVRGASNYEPIAYTGAYTGGDTGTDSSSAAVQRVFDSMTLPFDQPLPFAVLFEFPPAPIYFSTNDKGVIKPSSVSIDFLPFFGLQHYNTLYDISYPVRVSLYDERALAGKGYTFSFGLESNIRNNEPLVPGPRSQQQEFDEPTLFCDPLHFTSAPVSLSVRDGLTRRPAPDIQVLYDCGFSACPVGSTDAFGEFNGRFPICAGGQIVLLGEDIPPTVMEASPTLDDGLSLQATVEPFREKIVALDVHRLLKSGNGWSRSNAEGLALGETALVFFTEVHGKHSTVVQISGNDAPHEVHQIRIVPGTYSVSAQVLYDNPLSPIVIQPRRHTAGLFDDQTYYVPAETMRMSSALLGGISLESDEQHFVVVPSELDLATTLFVPVVVYDIIAIPEPARVIEDLNAPQQMQEYTQQMNLRPYLR